MKNKSLISFLSQHLVPLSIIFEMKKKDYPYIATAFVLSAEDMWFLVTAGHVAKDILSYLNNHEYHLKEANLLDSGGYYANFTNPIPFALDPDKLIVFGDETTNDYAVIHLIPYYISLLEANGVKPLDEKVWLNKCKEPDCFKILGVANQLVSPMWNNKNEVTNINLNITLHDLEHSPQRPKGINERDFDRWYGYISLDSTIDDIKGMSGAPIFAFKQTDKGWKYWLIGVQSSWNSNNNAIAACPAKYLGVLLATLVKEFRRQKTSP